MPFDNTNSGACAEVESQSLRERASASARMLDDLLVLFDGGKRWRRWDDTDGGFCLRGGIDHLHKRGVGGGVGAIAYLHEAVWERHGFYSMKKPLFLPMIFLFNDACADYRPIKRVIRRARALAIADAGNKVSAGCARRLRQLAGAFAFAALVIVGGLAKASMTKPHPRPVIACGCMARKVYQPDAATPRLAFKDWGD